MTTRSRQRWPLLWLLFTLIAGGGLLGCPYQPRRFLRPQLPLHVENKPLVPKGAPPLPTHWETNSAVLPPGNALCPAGCVFIGYGNLGVSLMHGQLSCLGQADCLENVTIPVPADLVSGVNGSVSVEGGGMCVGGDTPSQARYALAYTDSAITRAFDNSIVFVAGAWEYFADPNDSCKLHKHIVNLITRTEDAGAHWIHAAVLNGRDPGDPYYFGGMDRPTIYADPSDQTLYLTGGGAIVEGGGLNTVALWSSSTHGKTWTRVGNPVGTYGFASNLALVGTPGRLFIGFCPYGDQVGPLPSGLPDPDKAGKPVLGWSDDGGRTFKYADVFYDSAPESRCGLGVIKHKDGRIMNNFPAFTLSRASRQRSSIESIRVAYSTLTSTGRQTFRVVTARVSRTGTGKVLSLKPSFAPELPGDVAAIHPDFVPTDRFELTDSEPLNDAALLSWLEVNDVASTPQQMTVRYRLVVGEASWSWTYDLSFLKVGNAAVQPVAWKPNLVNLAQPNDPKIYFASDIDEGSFYVDKTKSPPTLNFLTTWTQSHDADTAPNGYIHFNIVSVNEFVSIGNN